MSYSISSFSNYMNENNYPNIASGDYSSNTAQNTGFITDPYMSIDSSIFSSADDYSSDYDAIFDAFHKQMDDIAAEREAQEAQKADETDETDETEGTDSTDKTEGTTGTSSADKTDSDEEVDGDESESDTEGSKAGDDDSDSLVAEHQEKVRDGFNADAVAASFNTAFIELYYKSDSYINDYGVDTAAELNKGDKILAKYIFNDETKLNGTELAQVAEAYEEKYGKSIEQEIWDRCHRGYAADLPAAAFRNATEIFDEVDEDGNVVSSRYISDIQNDEELSDDFMDYMCQKFYNATEGDTWTNYTTMWEVLSLKPEALRQVIEYYNNSSYSDLNSFEDMLKQEGCYYEHTDYVKEVYKEAMGKELE